MNSVDMVTDFKLRVDKYKTPVGTFGYRNLAVDALKKAGLSPEDETLIEHTITMATVESLLKALNLYCGKLAEEYDFGTSAGIARRYENSPRIPVKYRSLVAFALEGDNEGYYVHVGALIAGEGRAPTTYVEFGIAKTYSSESAYRMAMECSRFLAAAAWS